MSQSTQHYSNRPKNGAIKYIVIHYPAMPERNALTVEKYFRSTKRSVSTHYIVDECRVISLVDCFYRAYHVGSKKDHDLIYTNCINCCKVPPRAWECSNADSIGIDICDHKRDYRSLSAEDRDWYFSEEAIKRAARLVADIMRVHKIPIENVVRHYDVTGKLCPRPFVGSDTNVVTGRSGDEEWSRFLEIVKQIQSGD